MGSIVGWLERFEARLRRHLARSAAALIAVGLACAGVPGAAVAGSAPAALVKATSPERAIISDPRSGRVGVEAAALALVASVGGLEVDRGSRLGPWVRSAGALVAVDRCPPSELQVSWEPPVGEHRVGAYVAPLGPPPLEVRSSAAGTRVNGVVVCRSSSYAFLGFEAAWDGLRWRVAAVPSSVADGDAPLLEGEAEAEGATPVGDGAPGVALPPTSAWGDEPLEALAAYVPQTTCDPVAKPGVLGFRDLLLGAHPGTRNLGIGRVCEAEGVSEHKEGRAFDWGVRTDDPAERAAADAVLAWLLGPDGRGEPHAMARRVGLMYVIWDGQIWSAFRAADGWRPYVGVSEHRDHVHFSFDWPGALAQTSFWIGGHAPVGAGSEAPDLPLVPAASPPAALLAPSLLRLLPLPATAPVAPLVPGARSDTSGESDDSPGGPPTTTSPPPTTTTTAPPTTTTAAPPPTTTTTAPPVVTVPTTIRLGSL